MPPVVDCHLHVWSDDTEKYPRDEVPYPGSPELLLEYMGEAEVDHAVVVKSQHYKFDNAYLVDVLEGNPDVFAGVGVIDPRGQEAADELERLVSETKIRGIRLRGTIEPSWYCQPETDPLWQKSAHLGTPLCLLGTPEQIDLVKAAVQRHPDTTAVIDHFSMIHCSEGTNHPPLKTFLSLSEQPNVYIKVSGLHYWGDHYPFPKGQDNLRAAYDAFGPERMMWGSDFPHILFGYGYVRCCNFIRRDIDWLSQEEKDLILGGNAYRIWWENQSNR